MSTSTPATFFNDLIGNEEIKQQLTLMTSSGRVGQSVLFAGPDGVGKGLFAYRLATALLCQHDTRGVHRHRVDNHRHTDIRICWPEGKTGMHSMETMRQLTEEVYTPPYEAPCKVFILHEAERMLPYSANALLKTFEEPALTSVIILLSSRPHLMLPTILSRCRTLYFQPITTEQIAHSLHTTRGLSLEEAQKIAHASQGSLGRALHLVGTPSIAEAAVIPLVLNFLSKGQGRPYNEITQVVELAGQWIDHLKKAAEESAQEKFMHSMGDAMTAVQKQAIEKEIEGIIAMSYLREVDDLLEAILGWYRDIQLLAVKGNPAYLMHREYQKATERALQRGEMRPLEDVMKAISATRLSVERSTAFTTALETLLLTLNTQSQRF